MTRGNPESLADLRAAIEADFERRATLASDEIDAVVRPRVEQAIALLESGQVRVAEPVDGGLVVKVLMISLDPAMRLSLQWPLGWIVAVVGYSVLLGADWFEDGRTPETPPLGIGRSSRFW